MLKYTLERESKYQSINNAEHKLDKTKLSSIAFYFAILLQEFIHKNFNLAAL